MIISRSSLFVTRKFTFANPNWIDPELINATVINKQTTSLGTRSRRVFCKPFRRISTLVTTRSPVASHCYHQQFDSFTMLQNSSFSRHSKLNNVWLERQSVPVTSLKCNERHSKRIAADAQTSINKPNQQARSDKSSKANFARKGLISNRSRVHWAKSGGTRYNRRRRFYEIKDSSNIMEIRRWKSFI